MDSPALSKGRISHNPWSLASALAIAWAFYQVFELLYWQAWTNLPLNQGPGPLARGQALTNMVLVFWAFVTLALPSCRRLDRTNWRLRQALVLAPIVIFFAMHVWCWQLSRRSAWIWVDDIGKTTIAADRALLRGKNPYAIRLDEKAEQAVPGAHMDGYKYFPITLAVYLPAATWETDGDQAVLATNLVLSVMAAAALGMCLWKWISLDGALIGVLLFFMSRLISQEQVRQGTNDVIPMILVFTALYCIERRFTAGLLVGLAISSKLLPSLLWICLCLTPKSNRRYAAGVAAGLAPCVLFLIWNPAAMLRNTIIFPLTRPHEPGSLLYGLPAGFQLAAQLAVVGAFAVFAIRAIAVEIPPIRRCVHAAGLTLCFELAAPVLHANYFIWWYMPLCVAITGLMFNPISYEWISRRHRL